MKTKAFLKALAPVLLIFLVGAGIPERPAAQDQASKGIRTVPSTDRTDPASPSPSLGSSSQRPDATPEDDSDGDPADFTQVGLAVGVPLVLGSLVGGSVIFYFVRRARRR
jgi:hypothetical protein